MEIILENFRSFVQRQSIPITPLTFLVGENSSGKSTFMAALSAVDRQVFYDYKPQLNDPPYDLGSFDTIATYKGGRYGRAEYFVLGSKINTDNKETSVVTIFKEDRGQPVFWKIEINRQNGSIAMELKDQTIKGEVSLPSLLNQPYEFSRPFPFSRRRGGNEQLELFEPFEIGNWYAFLIERVAFDIAEKHDKKENTFNRIYSFLRATKIRGKPDIAIAPIRTKPRRTYDEINDEYKPEGDHIPIILSRVLNEDNRQRQTLLDALKSYGAASGLFKNVKVKRLGKRPSDPFQLFVTISGGREANIVDVGYGVNQALPVLVESILAPDDRRITMQQPEVHLHPRAQAALGSFMVDLVQKHKKQFVVETHSDHIVDRVRQEVAAGRIDKDKVSILFFEKPGFETTVHVLKLDKQGNILNAPASYREFFLNEQMNLLMA